MAKSFRRQLRQIDRARTLSAEERTRLILDERTRRLAGRSSGPSESAEETAQVLICEAGPERYGIPLGAVLEVLPYQTCVPVPDAPQALVGVFGRNGHLVSVIDLGQVLGAGSASPESGSQHLVVLRRDKPRIALRVDRAHAVTAVSPLAPDRAGAFRNDAVIGYAEARHGFADQDRVLSLLDIDRLIRPFLPSSVPGV